MNRVRLSILIPLLLILSSVASSGILFWQEIRTARSNIEQTGVENLHTTLTQLQNVLNTQLAVDNLEDARLSLAVSALHPGIRTLLLADEHDTVMLANHYIWEGSPAHEVSGYVDAAARQVRQGQSSVVSHQAGLLSGYYPVTLKIVAGGLGRNRSGVLFVEYDLAPKLAQARYSATVQAVSFGSLMIAVSMLAALLLHSLISRRVEKIVGVSKRFAGGDMDARVSLWGKDELAELGRAFNDMASQRKAAHEAARQAGIYNRSLIEASLDPLVTISAAGKITDVNRATEQVTGHHRSELIGTDFSDYFTEPDKARAGYRQVFAEGTVTDYPLAIRHQDGHITDVLYNASVYRNEAGEVLGVFAAARDISEQQRAALLRAQLAAIVESSRDAIIGKSLDGKIVSWNKGAEAIYGYCAEEIIGKPITVLAAAELHEEMLACLEKVRQGGTVENYETERVRKDGSLIHVALTLSPISDASGKTSGISTIERDISERKRAEQALREQERHSQSLLRLSRSLEKAQSYSEVLSAARQEVREVFGYQNLWVYLFSDDCKYATALVGEGRDAELALSEEGTPRLVIAGDPMLEAIAQAKDIVVVEDARTSPLVNKEIVAKLDCRSIVNVPIVLFDRHLGSVGTGTFGDEGVRVPSDAERKFLLSLASHMAVTLDRIFLQAERRKAEAEVRELNRDLERRVVERTEQLEAANKELEAFAYSVSHDLRAPLRAIDGFSHILEEDYTDKLDAEGKRLLGVVRDNAARMGMLIDDILKFSRAGRLELNAGEIDMEKMAQAVLAELVPDADESRLHVEIGHLPPARGDSAMMRQVFVNLLSNALKFSRNRQPAQIRVGSRMEGGETVYFVQDNGAGFDMRYADKLFGVFQRLHSTNEFEGTGIGLAIVKRIVNRHGGRVWAEGKVDEGATLYFSLPTVAATMQGSAG